MYDRKTAEKIRARLEKLEIEQAELQTALRVVEDLAADDDDLVTTVADVATPTTAPQSGEPWVYPGVDIDFAGATNLLERVIRIAEIVDGPLDSMDMARCLVQRRISKAAPHNLRSHITNELKGHASFPKIGPGKYQYTPESQADGETLTPSSSSTSNPS